MGIPAYEGVGFAGIWTEKIENGRGNHIRFASRWNKARKMSEKQIRKLRMKRVVNFNFQFYLFFICCFRIFPEKSGKRNLSFTFRCTEIKRDDSATNERFNSKLFIIKLSSLNSLVISNIIMIALQVIPTTYLHLNENEALRTPYPTHDSDINTPLNNFRIIAFITDIIPYLSNCLMNTQMTTFSTVCYSSYNTVNRTFTFPFKFNQEQTINEFVSKV